MEMIVMPRKLKKKTKKRVSREKRVKNIGIPLLLLLILVISLVIIVRSGILTATSSSTNTKTKAAGYTCPSTSSQSYESIRPGTPPHRKISNPENSPEVNINLRGWGEVSEAKEPVNYGGDTDPNPPPSIGSVFQGHWPQIIKTYIIYEWDWSNNKPNIGKSATPAWPVHLIGFSATPGEPLLGLQAGRTIDGKHSLMVLYADANSITFTHSTGDAAPPEDDGYPIYFVDVCVDPNLLALYQRNNAGGRGELPAVAPGQVFGYAKDTDPKFAIRDTGSFMDPRAKKDWWQFGPPAGPTYPPINQPTVTALPTTFVPPTNVPPTQPPLVQPSSTPILQVPTSTLMPIPPTVPNTSPSLSPSLPPTTVPTLTLTPTPTKTLTQIVITSPVYQWVKDLAGSLVNYLKVILP